MVSSSFLRLYLGILYHDFSRTTQKRKPCGLCFKTMLGFEVAVHVFSTLRDGDFLCQRSTSPLLNFSAIPDLSRTPRCNIASTFATPVELTNYLQWYWNLLWICYYCYLFRWSNKQVNCFFPQLFINSTRQERQQVLLLTEPTWIAKWMMCLKIHQFPAPLLGDLKTPPNWVAQRFCHWIRLSSASATQQNIVELTLPKSDHLPRTKVQITNTIRVYIIS